MAHLVSQSMGVTTPRYYTNIIWEIFFQKKFMSHTIKTQKIFVSHGSIKKILVPYPKTLVLYSQEIMNSPLSTLGFYLKVW